MLLMPKAKYLVSSRVKWQVLNFSKNVQTHFEKCCQNYLVEFSNMENKSKVSGKTLPQIHRKLLTILLMHK